LEWGVGRREPESKFAAAIARLAVARDNDVDDEGKQGMSWRRHDGICVDVVPDAAAAQVL